MNRKIAVIVVTALQLVLLACLLTWHVRGWQLKGWTGLGYSPVVPEEAEQFSMLAPFGSRSSEVAVIAPRSPAARSDVTDADTVLSVNGIDVTDVDAVRGLAQSARKGDTITYRLENEHGVREIALVLESPFRSPYVIANLTTGVLVGIIWLAISLLVYWSRPDSRPAMVFFLLCSIAAAMYFVWSVSETLVPNLQGILPMSFEPLSFVAFGTLAVLSVLFANFLLHLSLIFPKQRPVVDRWPKVFLWLHTIPFLNVVVLPAIVLGAFSGKHLWSLLVFEAAAVVAASALAVNLTRSIRLSGWRQAISARPLQVQLQFLILCTQFGLALRLIPDKIGIVFGVLFGTSIALLFVGWITLYSILTCVALYRSYRESGVEVRHQVRWPLWGTLTALGGSFVILIFSIVLGYAVASFGATAYALASAASVISKAVYLLIPIGFAFAILKYRLLDIDIIIRKTVIYSGATGIVLALYLALAGVSGLALVKTAGLQSEAATVLATLAVVALFVPIRNRVQSFVDRRFFQHERDLAAAGREISDLVLEGGTLEHLLPRFAEIVQQAMRNRSVAVFLPAGGSLRAEVSVGLPDRTGDPPTLSLEADFLSQPASVVRVDRTPMSEDDARALRRVRAAALALARRSDELVGVIAAGPKLDLEDFDDDDEAFLSAVAAQLVLAVGRSDQRRSKAELTQAREIQESLLPAGLPQIDGVNVAARWEPAREVGGDYYDVLRLDENRLALCIGDVVGKGMPAALLMSSLQAALKAVAFQSTSPREVCSRVRDVMLQNLAGGTFVTFFFCIIDRSEGRIIYCNAGHNPPILVRADRTVVRLELGGPIFARIAADRPYQEAAVDLGAGDRIVLYTDGVTEAEDPMGEMYEDSRLERFVIDHSELEPAALERAIIDSVLGHAHGSFQDDLTLVVAAIS